MEDKSQITRLQQDSESTSKEWLDWLNRNDAKTQLDESVRNTAKPASNN